MSSFFSVRVSLPILCVLAILSSTGCSICAPGFLDDYATVGGKWQRADPSTGRVGSIFSDPGSTVQAGTQHSVGGSSYGDQQFGAFEDYDNQGAIEYYEDSSNYGELQPGEFYDDGTLPAEQGTYEDGTIILGDDF